MIHITAKGKKQGTSPAAGGSVSATFGGVGFDDPFEIRTRYNKEKT